MTNSDALKGRVKTSTGESIVAVWTEKGGRALVGILKKRENQERKNEAKGGGVPSKLQGKIGISDVGGKCKIKLNEGKKRIRGAREGRDNSKAWTRTVSD